MHSTSCTGAALRTNSCSPVRSKWRNPGESWNTSCTRKPDSSAPPDLPSGPTISICSLDWHTFRQLKGKLPDQQRRHLQTSGMQNPRSYAPFAMSLQHQNIFCGYANGIETKTTSHSRQNGWSASPAKKKSPCGPRAGYLSNHKNTCTPTRATAYGKTSNP